MDEILKVIEFALVRSGYLLIDGKQDSIVIRDKEKDMDYTIKVKEIAQ